MDQRTRGWVRAAVAGGAVTALVAASSAATAAPQHRTAAPDNVIVFIGDGMGYNHVANTNLYETGQTGYQVTTDADGEVRTLPGDPVQVYETWPLVAMSTYQYGNSYEAERAWSDFGYVNEDYTDSAAAGSAMATGVKTTNGATGLDPEGNRVENLTERAIATGRAAGVVSSVPFSHATPASYVAHNADRNDYQGIAAEMLGSDLDVIMGAGHPEFDDSNERLDEPEYRYVSEADLERARSGATGFTYIEEKSQFEALAAGEDVPERVFGLAQVASTLQQGRALQGEENLPYDTPLNEDVPDLPTMTEGAINVLEQDEDGFFLMVEGGAIDWTGHANDTVRNIEETRDFNAAVEAAVEWVESDESDASWEDTLIIVTADHETGYLIGADSDPAWTPMTGQAGELPVVGWYSGDHTNALVPVWAKGAGTEELFARADGVDHIRGAYIDNTDLANVLLEDLWALPVDPAVEELARSLDEYVAAGDVAGPIAHQLRSAADQALRHLEGERLTPATRAMERFVMHLENPKRSDTLSDHAADDLGAQAADILDQLR